MASTKRLKISEIEDVAPLAPQQASKPASQPAAERAIKRGQPSRAARKAVTIWFDADVHKQLKRASVDREMTIQDVMEVALDDWFAKQALHRFRKRPSDPASQRSSPPASQEAGEPADQ